MLTYYVTIGGIEYKLYQREGVPVGDEIRNAIKMFTPYEMWESEIRGALNATRAIPNGAISYVDDTVSWRIEQ
jgi:hypothetical protein